MGKPVKFDESLLTDLAQEFPRAFIEYNARNLSMYEYKLIDKNLDVADDTPYRFEDLEKGYVYQIEMMPGYLLFATDPPNSAVCHLSITGAISVEDVLRAVMMPSVPFYVKEGEKIRSIQEIYANKDGKIKKVGSIFILKNGAIRQLM